MRRGAAARGHRDAVGGGTRLRNPADAPVFDHPVASLRLHDDQRGAAGLRRGGNLRRHGAARAAGALCAGRRRRRDVVRCPRRGGLPACAAGRVQSAGNALGSAAVGAPARCLWAAVRSVLLRRDCAVPHVHAVRRAVPADLQLRHSRRRCGKPRDSGRAVRAFSHRGVAGDRDAGARGGGRCRLPSRPAPAGARVCAARRRHRAADWRPRGLGPPACVPVQGALPDPADTRGAHRRGTVEPAGGGHRRREPGGALSPCAGVEPQRAGRTAAAARRLRRRRRARRPDALRRAARTARASRLSDLCAAVPPADPAARAGARRGRRCRRAAGDLSRAACRRRRGAESADHRSGSGPLRRLLGTSLQLTGRARAHRRSARLRHAASRALRPDRGRIARRVRRVVGRALRVVGELSLHRRGARGVSRSPRAGRHARGDTLDQSAAPRRTEAVRHGHRGARTTRRCRSGASTGADPGLEDRDAAGEERGVHRRRDRGTS